MILIDEEKKSEDIASAILTSLVEDRRLVGFSMVDVFRYQKVAELELIAE